MEKEQQIKKALAIFVNVIFLLVIVVVGKLVQKDDVANTEMNTETESEFYAEEVVMEEPKEIEEIVIETEVEEPSEPIYQEPVVEIESEEPVALPPEEIVPPETEREIQEPETEEEIDDGSHYIPIPEEWNLIVVNKWNRIPENYTVELTEISGGETVDSRIVASIDEMFAAAAESGVLLKVREGYRTTEEQQAIFDEKVQKYVSVGYSQEKAEKMAKKWVALPGTSEHELGLAVDINADQTDGYNDRAYAWLAEHAHEYGFILRYPEGKEDITGIEYEPWHFRYVGLEVAQEIYTGGICLEEYLQSR